MGCSVRDRFNKKGETIKKHNFLQKGVIDTTHNDNNTEEQFFSDWFTMKIASNSMMSHKFDDVTRIDYVKRIYFTDLTQLVMMTAPLVDE